MNTKPGSPVMGIRPGQTVIFSSAKEAARAAVVTTTTVYKLIQTGRQSKSGWCFDYPLEGVC